MEREESEREERREKKVRVVIGQQVCSLVDWNE